MHVSDIDWSAWKPKDTATLLFVIDHGRALLIRKKRGLGAGKINAPGGRLDPGETARDAAVREVREELGVTPLEPRERGTLAFEFVDGYRLFCHVFSSDRCEGEPVETPEAIPLWTSLESVPYDEMWADDALWLPKMLAGYRFDGRFVFDGDRLLSHELTLHDPASALFEALRARGIDHEVRVHPPVFTVAQAQRHRPADERGVHVKNLFVRDKKGAMWLVTVPEDATVDLASLASKLGTKHLSFASYARLRTHLGVEPGSVTPLAALNDHERAVRVAMSASLLDEPIVRCHPMTNDRTIGLSGAAIRALLESSGHPPIAIE
ncbi:MAG: NUDIX domain-containing protein [Myxococcales bacterium]|nr:NUDIX domain-containing protein [Myxococcales bacterium]